MVRDDLTIEQYHAGEGISKSDLDLIHISPAHYKAKSAKADSRAFFIGEAAHLAILEPENSPSPIRFCLKALTAAQKKARHF